MLTPMSAGGRWMKPPHDGPAVYVAAKQVEAHIPRLVIEKWMPCEDPRTDDGAPAGAGHAQDVPLTTREVSMQGQLVAQQTQIDQLTTLVQQLLASQQQSDVHDDHGREPAPVVEEVSKAPRRKG